MVVFPIQASGSTSSHGGHTQLEMTSTSNGMDNTLLASPVANQEGTMANQVQFGRVLSQTPTALRMRKWRKNMMLDQEKYEKLKKYDWMRSKKTRNNLTNEQKERSRDLSRERTRRCRLRKKLLNSLGNEAGVQEASQGKHTEWLKTNEQTKQHQ